MRRFTLLGSAAILILGSVSGVRPATAALPRELPVYNVVKSGLTADEARRLADAFGVPLWYAEDGSFDYAGDTMAGVPLKPADASMLPRDEGGMEAVAQAFRLRSIKAIKPIDNATAERMTLDAFTAADLPLPGPAKMTESNTVLKIRSVDARVSFTRAIDTSVKFDFMLGEQHLVGPGAKVDVTYDPAGKVTELHFAARDVQQGEIMPLIPVADAKRACAPHYPPGSTMMTPRLVYWAPGLGSAVRTIFPHYECRGTGPQGQALVPALLPALEGAVPVAQILPMVTATTSMPPSK